MSSSALLTTQDLKDLDEIKSHLPAGDPRHAKIDMLVQAQQPSPPGSAPNLPIKEMHGLLNPVDPIQKMQDKVYGTQQEGQLNDAPLPFGPSAVQAPLKMAMSVGRSVAGGYAGSEIGGRFGPVGRVLGGLIGSGIGYKSPDIAEGVANRFIGEENVPMWMKSPRSVGRMVDSARNDMYNDLGGRAMSRPDIPEVRPFAPQGASVSNQVSPIPEANVNPSPTASTSTGPQPNMIIRPAMAPVKQVDPVALAVRRGEAAKLPTRMPVQADPVASAIRRGDAARLPVRMPKIEPELGSPENPGLNAPMPTRMPNPVREAVSRGDAARLPMRMPKPPQGEITSQEIITPERAAAERGMPRVGNEGSAARWTNSDAMRILRDDVSTVADRREAAMTLTRRGIQLPDNYRYLLGDQAPGSVAYNPKDITKFTPEGTPIRQGGKLKPFIDPYSPTR